MHKAKDASWPRSLATKVCMYDSELRPNRVVSFRIVATQNTSPTNRTLLRMTSPMVTLSGDDVPRFVHGTTRPSIAKATRSFTSATETIARPSLEFKRFRSRRIRTLTGRAVTAKAVPRNRDCAKVMPRAAAKLYPKENGRKNSTKATTMLRSLNAFRRPSRPSSIPARSTRMKTPRLATTFNDSPNEVVGSGLMRPRTIGPTRIPASTSPIIGDWWSFSIASPAARAVTKMISRPRIRSTGPHYLGTQSTKPAAIYSFLRGYPRCEPRMTLKDKLRVGCSGWGYDDWLGGFYPPDTPKSDYLKLYSSVFDCVEVESSFYCKPGPPTTKRGCH